VFGGAHELSMDSKGRLAIPAKFRDILLRRYMWSHWIPEKNY